MKYVKWAAMAPMMLAVTIASVIFAPVIALPFFYEERDGLQSNSTQYGRGLYLKHWLSWFQTPDNDAFGDNGWKVEHWQWRYKLPTQSLVEYAGRVGWLMRNPGYGFGCRVVSAPAVGTDDGEYAQTGDLWQLTKWGGKLNIGWNIRGAFGGPTRQHVASYALSIRLKV